MSSACTREGSISPALSATLRARRGGRRLQTARTISELLLREPHQLRQDDVEQRDPAETCSSRCAERAAHENHAPDPFGPLAIGFEGHLTSHRVPDENAGRIPDVTPDRSEIRGMRRDASMRSGIHAGSERYVRGLDSANAPAGERPESAAQRYFQMKPSQRMPSLRMACTSEGPYPAVRVRT